MFPSFHFSRENSVTLVSSYDVNKVFDEGMNQLMLANFEEALIAFSSCIEHHNEKVCKHIKSLKQVFAPNHY